MIPTNDQGYRQAVDSLVTAVEQVVQLETRVERARAEVASKREQLNTCVAKLLAHEEKKKLGPDGGK